MRLRSLAYVFFVAAALIPAGASRAAPAGAANAPSRWVRPGTTHAGVVGGFLTSPSTQAPVDVVRAYLATGPEPIAGIDPTTLRVERVRPLPGGGAGVKLVQTIGGLDVIGGNVAVRVDGEGRVRWIAGSVAQLPAGFVTTPAIDQAQAIAAVHAGPAQHLRGTPIDPATPRLVVFTAGPAIAPRLAWRVMVPGNLATMETLRVTVDAETGAILYRENLVHRAYEANVFAQNPVSTPTVVQQSLAAYVNPGATQLDGPDILGRNCIDNLTCMPFEFMGMMLNVHTCEMIPHATIDPGTSDFLAITRPALDTEAEDDFAEIQMFFHANKAYEFFRGFGFTNLNQHPMQAVANLRIPDFNDPLAALCSGSPPAAQPGSELVAIDNAAFFPSGGVGGFPAEDMIIFGQGTTVDLAYDGDVVYHEFTHALMGTVCPSYGPAVPDQFGLDLTPHGTYEGYADFFAAALTNDPGMGDYAGAGLTGIPGPLRTADNTKTCPNDLWGEEHQDGEPWLGALWDIRAPLSVANQAKFDLAVYVVLDLLGANDTPIGGTAAAIAAEVGVQIDAATEAAATTAFAARGYDDCDDRVIDLTAGGAKDVLNLRGTDYLGIQTLIPGVVQFKIDVPEDSTAINVAIAASQAGGGGLPGTGGTPAVKLLVKQDAPILWTWTPSSATPDATAMADVMFSTAGNAPGSASVTSPDGFPAGTYYVQLANAGASVFVQQVTFANTPGALPTPDAGPTPDAAATPDAGTGQDGGGGDCGCRVGGTDDRTPSGGLAFALAGIAALLLVLRRRQRR